MAKVMVILRKIRRKEEESRGLQTGQLHLNSRQDYEASPHGSHF